MKIVVTLALACAAFPLAASAQDTAASPAPTTAAAVVAVPPLKPFG